MYKMQLHVTVNKLTGNKRYYADNVRISKNRYEYLEILYKRWDCLVVKSNEKQTVFYKNVSYSK